MQHHAAHAGNDDANRHPEPPDRPHIPRGPAELITTGVALGQFIDHARACGRLAFDTEFIGEVAYFPRTCLIQLATEERIALVDPFECNDLAPLWHLVSDGEVETIVHAGASDLSPVRRGTRREPENMIDVQVAAGFVGLAYPSSLAKLVAHFIAFDLPKGHTFTDWDARPLSASQMRYAADDVRYLPLIWSILHEELTQNGRLAWARAETAARLADPHEFDVESHMRRASRGYDLTEAQERLLRALCSVRDEIARAEDMPHRSTIPDGALLEIVRSRPATPAAIAALRGMPRPIVARHGELFMQALGENPSEVVEWFTVRRRREEAPGARAAIDRMLAEAQRLAESARIAAQLVVSRADLERFVRKNVAARTHGQPPIPLFAPDDWRAQAFGGAIESAGGEEWLTGAAPGHQPDSV